MKNVFRATLVMVLMFAMGFAGIPAPAKAAPTHGSLIKRADHAAVYYYGADGKRYVFPNERVFKTWYADFSGVQTVTADEMAAIQIGGNVTYRPGFKMIKIDTDPKVYAVSRGGVLRHIASEAVASAIFGAGWAALVDDIPDAFFVNYTHGAAIASASEYSRDAELASATHISADKNLGTPTTTTPPPPAPTPAPTPSCTADTWSCGDWSACSASGTQTRTCTMTNDCAGVVTPSPAVSQSCTAPAPTPAPTGQMPNVPADHTLADLIADPGFETSLGGFEPNSSSDGSVAHETANPIAGAKSLRVNVNGYGRIWHYHDYAWEAGPYADSLTAKAKVRVESGSSASKKLQVCSIAYVQGDANPKSKCQEYPIAAATVVDVYQSLPLAGAQLDRVLFQFKLNDGGTISAAVEDAHFYVVQKTSSAPAPTPTPSPTPSPTPTPTPTPSPSTDLEVAGYNARPTNYRSMTAEMDLRNDVSSNGAAANATAKDVTVTLHPAADAVGAVRRVSFGLPLAPGTLVNAANVKVTNASGQEIPAFVRSLGAWEQMPPQALLCNGLTASGNPGIRSVLVQFDMNFPSTAPVTVTVGLNRARTQSLPTETPVADTYRVVNDGTYAPSVNTSGLTIREPRVLAAIDHEYLSCASLVPMVNLAGTRAYMADSDQATDDFFYSLINQHSVKQSWPVTSSEDMIDFYTDPEPWLYDRAQTFYNGYLRTGNVDMLREANRAANHYAQNIYGPESCSGTYYPYCVGSFKLKNPTATNSWHDMKYSYSENLLTNYLLNGDATVLKKIGYISWGMEFHINLEGTGETERHRGYALLAHAVDAELTGSAHQRSVVNDGIAAMRARQTSPLDGNAPNGCFNYPPEGDAHTFSPWMSSLLAYGHLRAYHAVGTPSVPASLVDLARCEVERGIEPLTPPQDGPMTDGRWYPYYIAASFGPKRDTDPNPYDGFEHSLDVGVAVALGAYFSTDAAQKATLSNAVKELLLTHDESIAYWTRNSTGRSKYRTNPPRKYLWQYKNANVVGWALDGKGTY